MKKNSFEPIAVISAGAIFAQAQNLTDYWRNIVNKKDLISEIPQDHWLIDDYYEADPGKANQTDKIYTRYGSFIENVKFNPVLFGIPPNSIEAIDTAQLLALIVAKQVLDEAGQQQTEKLDLSRTSVILGSSTLEAVQYLSARMQHPVWRRVVERLGLGQEVTDKVCQAISDHYTPLQENTFPGLLSNVIAGRIANRLDLGGTNCTTDAACASSFAAMTMAIHELQLGIADMAITGGVDALNDLIMYKCFTLVGALSSSSTCRPFDQASDGTLLGEGVALFALKRLSDAERDGNEIYGVIRSIGSSSDGISKSIYAPVASGQARALNNTYNQTDYAINTVELWEAHGTGTIAGDIAEYQGVITAFDDAGDWRHQQCALGTVKSQLGHTKAAAGAAGLLKALLALRHKTLPPTINVDKPNQKFHVEDGPLYINSETRPWVRAADHPRRAGISSFGFGGSNYHVALEEYTGSGKISKRLRSCEAELIVLSAQDSVQLAKKLTEFLLLQGDLAQLAYRSQQAISANECCRLAIISTTLEQLHSQLKQVQQHLQAGQLHSNANAGWYFAERACEGKIAFLFPGQGSQYVNMGRDLLLYDDASISLWDAHGSQALHDSKALHQVVFPPPAFDFATEKTYTQRLKEPRWAQPALALVSLTQLELFKRLGITPDCVAGHSFGEITALYAAGVIDQSTLMAIAAKRGSLMQHTSEPNGAMLAVRASAEVVEAVLAGLTTDVVVANYNSPEQQVLSGSTTAITEIERTLTEQKIDVIKLPVFSAFHSAMMQPVTKPFLEFLTPLAYANAQLPIYSNLDAQVYTDTTNIAERLAELITKPVKFQQTLENLYQQGVRTFVEVGAQAVLTGLAATSLADKPDVQVIAADSRNDNSMTQLQKALGQLFCTGVTPDFSALWQAYLPLDGEADSDDKKTFTVPLNGTNYNKPYPVNAEKNQALVDVITPMKPDTPATKPMTPTASKPTIAASTLTPQQPKCTGETMNTNSSPQQPVTPQQGTMMVSMDLQTQLIQAHNNYQSMMAQAHMTFLNTLMSLQQQPNTANGTQTVMDPMPIMQTPQVMPVAQVPVAPPPVAQTPVPPPVAPPPPAAVTPPPAPPAAVTPPPAPIAPPPPAAPAPVAATPTPVEQTPAPSSSGIDLQALVLEVVVEKTGYPAEMLNNDMEIEADLGIDSIKRVEILSNIKEKVPNLPELQTDELAALKTLGDIVTYIDNAQQGGGTAKKP